MIQALAKVRKKSFRQITDIWNGSPAGKLLLILFAGFAFTLVFGAWLCDDAYITFRVVDNFIHGYGLVWNIGERVQAYTNPLWMFVVALLSMVTREVFFTSLLASIVASLCAVGILVFRVSKSQLSSILALIVLIASGSFVSYSTSGLENCLIFLLAALFFWKYLECDSYDFRTLVLLTSLFSLSIVNRMDVALLLLPALCLAYWRNESVGLKRVIVSVVLGLMPFVAWEAFSIVYYGFPFPNTAYAKLNTGIPAMEYLVRGMWYYIMSFLQDPMALLVILIGSVLISLTRTTKRRLSLAGVLLYLLYTIWIGGDFMRGRFFAAPLFVVLLIFVSIDADRWRSIRLTSFKFAAGLMVLLIVQNFAALTYNAMAFDSSVPYGILNDKRIYFRSTSLPLNLVSPGVRSSELAREGDALRAEGESPVLRGTLGIAGYYAGPGVHMVDPYALNDALLARLPAIYNPNWHIGHVVRYVPDGYLESISTGRNLIKDPKLAEYYDNISIVIKGDLWTRERWEAIYRLNTGKLDGLIDREYYRFHVKNSFDPDSM